MLNNHNGYQHKENGTAHAAQAVPQTKNPKELLFKYRHYLPLFIICLAVFIGITYIYLRYKIPVYNSTVKILVKDDNKSGSESADELSAEILSKLVSSGKTNISNELEIIKSSTLMEKVVRKLGLNVIYTSIGNLRETEVYDKGKSKLIEFKSISDSSKQYEVNLQVLDGKLHYITDSANIEITNNTIVRTKDFSFIAHVDDFKEFKPDYTYNIKWYPPAVMASKLASELTVGSLSKDASIMLIAFSSGVPAKGRDILNGLAQEYSQAGIDEKNKTIDNTIQFVNDRLVLISGELGNVESSLQTFRETNNVINIAGQQQLDIDRLKEIKEKMDEAQVKLQVTDMIRDYVNDPAKKYNLVPTSLGIEDATMLALIEEYNKAALQREDLLKTIAPGNIAVKTIDSKLEQLQQKILETTGNIKASFQSVYNATRADYNQVVGNMSSMPGKEKKLLEIARQQGIKEKLYLFLLQKREEAAITRASAISNSRAIDPAVTNSIPVEPRTTLLYLLAIIAGIGVPFAIIYVRDLFNDKVTTAEDIQQATQAPIVGEINHNPGSSDRKIVVAQTRGVVSEQFRIIRTNLQYFLNSGKPISGILVTSTMAGEGKTFISMNLGAVLAVSGKKVLLMEFDLRKPKITAALNIENASQGITTYLSGKQDVSSILRQIKSVENYWLLPCGPIPPNPAELLLSPKLDQMFAELKEMFDYIIIDCPPLGIVSDAKILSKYSDINLYVVRQRYTLKKQLGFVNNLYTEQKLNNLALVVNDVILNGANGYYGYANTYGYGYTRYNYDYSYGSGYNSNAKDEKSLLKKMLGKKESD